MKCLLKRKARAKLIDVKLNITKLRTSSATQAPFTPPEKLTPNNVVAPMMTKH